MHTQPSPSHVTQLIERITPDLTVFWSPEQQAPAAPPAIEPPAPGTPALTQLDSIHAGLRGTLLAARGGHPVMHPMTQLADAIEAAIEQAPDTALAYLFMRNREDYPLLHAIHCAILVSLTATSAGLESAARRPLLCAALTQNISMNALQAELYDHDGSPGSLDRLIIRRHPVTGVGVLKALGVEDSDWLETVALHHERCDGSGYPFGLKGGDIPFGAQLIGAADTFCASVSARGYRAGRPAHEAMRDLFMGAGGLFEPQLGRRMVRTLGLYPPGTLVELRNRELALVLARGEEMECPRIMPLEREGGAITLIAEGELAPARVAPPERLPEGFDLARTWQALEAGSAPTAAPA